MNERLSLESGHELLLQMPPFAVSMKLLRTVVNELKSADLGDIKLNGQLDMAKVMQMDLPINALKNAVFQLVGSTAVEQALGDCMKGCQYQGEKITKDSFEGPDARQDYLPVAWEVMKFNLSPFFSGLTSKSSTDSPTPASDQK